MGACFLYTECDKRMRLLIRLYGIWDFTTIYYRGNILSVYMYYCSVLPTIIHYWSVPVFILTIANLFM